MKRVISLLVLFSVLFSFALADTEKDGYHFDDRGFLVGDDNPSSEYLLEDDERGNLVFRSLPHGLHHDGALVSLRFRTHPGRPPGGPHHPDRSQPLRPGRIGRYVRSAPQPCRPE